MKCLDCRHFVTAHAFLSSWHLFHIFQSCTILVYSIGHNGFLLHLGRFQHCNLGKFVWRTQVQTGNRGFIFHVVVFSRETFQTLAWKFLLCLPQKVFGIYIFPNFVHRRCSLRKGVLRNCGKLTEKLLCQSLYFNKVAGQACNFIKIEALAQEFSCEFSEISKNTFFTEYVWAAASIKHTQDGYILSVFFYNQVACNCSNSLKQEVKHSYYNLSIKGEKYQLDLSKLLMS